MTDYMDDFKLLRRDKRLESLNMTNVDIYDQNGNGIYQGMGKTLNLSMSGMLLEIYDDIPVQLNYGISLEVSLHNEQIVTVKGIVRWLHSHDGNITIGLQFLPLTCKVSDKIEHFLVNLSE